MFCPTVAHLLDPYTTQAASTITADGLVVLIKWVWLFWLHGLMLNLLIVQNEGFFVVKTDMDIVLHIALIIVLYVDYKSDLQGSNKKDCSNTPVGICALSAF